MAGLFRELTMCSKSRRRLPWSGRASAYCIYIVRRKLALERIKKDQDKHAAKNRDPLLYFLVKSYFEPITLPKLDVDTSRPLEECVEQCVAYLR